MDSYRELIVWQKAMDLAEEVYRIVRFFPGNEQFSLSDQLRRAAVSVPSNIAEGYGRNATKEYARFLNIARGSNNEVETQLLLSVRLGFVTEQTIGNAMQLCDEIGKMITALIKKLTQ